MPGRQVDALVACRVALPVAQGQQPFRRALHVDDAAITSILAGTMQRRQ